MIKSSSDIPQTNVVADYGQINGSLNDTRFSISQNIAFPTIYKRQKELLTAEWKNGLLNVNMKEFELKKMVTDVFYAMLFWQKKEELLKKADTLYANIYEKATLRLQKGESNILEKTTTESQKAGINIQLRQVRQELNTAGLQLQLLLNTDTLFAPILTSNNLMLSLSTIDIAKNPVLQMLEQEQQIAKKQIKVEQAKLLPGLIFGYNNNSFNGVGDNNKFYDSSNRFHSVQLGLLVPIFTQGQKAKISASKIALNIAESNFQQRNASLQNHYKKLLADWKNNLETIQYFENTGLKNANIITETAKKQFANGEINYLDFVMLINQSIAIQNNYIDAVKLLTDTIIQINYLTTN